MRLFEATHRALGAVEPALIVLDDVQWVDETSLALCHYVVRAAEATSQSLMLLVASRPSAEASSLGESLAHVLPSERLASLELGPLSDAEALELVEQLAPELDSVRRERLSVRARGSPFWLEALARTERPEVDAAQLVTARLRGAGRDASELLALLAAAGIRLAHDLIREAALVDIGAGRRGELSRRLAQWLAEVAGDDVRR